jgi:hypothetical protein
MHPALNPNRQTFAALLLASLCAGALLPAHAQLPTVTTRTEIWSGNGQPIDRDAQDRAQWEYWQLQRDQQRRQLELTRQQDAQLRQSQESIGQRALREQAQRNGTYTPAPPGLSDQERAWRDQQQMQREQWRQQREQTRQDDQRIRQQSEPLGQRALREQAQNRREQGRAATGGSR